MNTFINRIKELLQLNINNLWWILVGLIFVFLLGILITQVIYRTKLQNAILSAIEGENSRVKLFVDTCDREFKANLDIDKQRTEAESLPEKEEDLTQLQATSVASNDSIEFEAQPQIENKKEK